MKPEEILAELYSQNFFDDKQIELSALSGGTVSRVYQPDHVHAYHEAWTNWTKPI